VGQPAPALIARSFDGQTIDLRDLRGKLVVLNFWASWCGPCRSEMPLLDAVARDYRDRGVEVVGLSADDPHDRREAVKAARGVGYRTGLLTEASINAFGAPQVLPLTYIISPKGTLAAVLNANRGPLSAAQLREAIEAQLSGAGADRSPASAVTP
jgi:thiol-disulfide isomerase/thioredoxin